ncbi:hypothetical protein, partial [Pseudomonas viridiflava]|uniref:hypothetical protein n=1 Tax=Pseudomonas viridiflava TaxID=33069 RepID=UPI0013C2DE0C
MKKLTRWLAVSAVLSLTGITAVQASTTRASVIVAEKSATDHVAATQAAPSPFVTVSQIESAQPLKVAILQTNCQDPDPWYMFSG